MKFAARSSVFFHLTSLRVTSKFHRVFSVAAIVAELREFSSSTVPRIGRVVVEEFVRRNLLANFSAEMIASLSRSVLSRNFKFLKSLFGHDRRQRCTYSCAGSTAPAGKRLVCTDEFSNSGRGTRFADVFEK